jgi:hypothetical protein
MNKTLLISVALGAVLLFVIAKLVLFGLSDFIGLYSEPPPAYRGPMRFAFSTVMILLLIGTTGTLIKVMTRK